MTNFPALLNLRNGGTSVCLRITEWGIPQILHWGEDLGGLAAAQSQNFSRSQFSAVVSGNADISPLFSLVPQQSEGWVGTPGLVGSRKGKTLFSAFNLTNMKLTYQGTDGAASAMSAKLHDMEADIDLTLELEIVPSGIIRTRATITNTGADGYQVDSLLLGLPTPATETHVLDQTGHHLRERDIQKHEFTIGAHQRDTRIARGHELSSIHGTCEANTSWRSGLVHYAHVAWSGNTRTIAEKDTQGYQGLLAGELLLPGEVVLKKGEEYASPWIIGTWGRGLDEAAGRIHSFVRGRDNHPRTPRPVTLNAWEAVYFDQSLPHLLKLVDLAAEVGVERFVLDDGWFSGRRDDTSSLGDWTVSEEVWPEGLSPLADAVRAKGMQFGLWFEPEMINPDSQVARDHPDWMLSPRTHRPQEARHQQVMDLTNPGAFEHVKSQILAVLASTQIDYIKWDFNRDLYEAVSPASGIPAYHQQTLATYRLMEDIKKAHPDLEIESCAGGGGRIDLGIMDYAVRVWGSDCTDPIERMLIEAGTSLVLPPELVGSHVASPVSHQTGRTLSLALRASNAMFSHMGIEWDLASAPAEEIEQLASWVALHKELRPLLHSGRTVHVDHPDQGYWVHGVVSEDKNQAVFAVTRLRTSAQRPSPALCLPGLDSSISYRLRELLPKGIKSAIGEGEGTVSWWHEGLELPGTVLQRAGIRLPDLNPMQTVLMVLTAQ